MNNISNLKNCYGCGVCVKACPVNIIALKENDNGFYSPIIEHQDKCIECGICLKVCAFNHTEVCQNKNTLIKSYAGWSKNPNVRQWCSSGGCGFEIGKHLISNGYEAIGVKYNPETNRAEHFIATTVDDFMPSAGSKYIPSYTADAFAQIDKKKKYLVTGTPCQIDSMRRLIRHYRVEENFVLLDFFCHGVPSLLMWDKYSVLVKQKFGKLSFVSWRNKTAGWHDSWAINADANKDVKYNLLEKEPKHQYFSRLTTGDLFYVFFLGNYCLNHCCYYACKYKMFDSAADIRIGDLWGEKYKENKDGISAVIALTPTGETILKEMQYSTELQQEDGAIVTEGQMRKCAHKSSILSQVTTSLRTQLSLPQIYQKVIQRHNKRMIPIRIINKILKTLRLPIIGY